MATSRKMLLISSLSRASHGSGRQPDLETICKAWCSCARCAYMWAWRQQKGLQYSDRPYCHKLKVRTWVRRDGIQETMALDFIHQFSMDGMQDGLQEEDPAELSSDDEVRVTLHSNNNM